MSAILEPVRIGAMLEPVRMGASPNPASITGDTTSRRRRSRPRGSPEALASVDRAASEAHRPAFWIVLGIGREFGYLGEAEGRAAPEIATSCPCEPRRVGVQHAHRVLRSLRSCPELANGPGGGDVQAGIYSAVSADRGESVGMGFGNTGSSASRMR